MRIGQTSILYFGSKFFGSAIGFLATVYFARELGETILGHYFLVLAVVSWIAIVGKVGLSDAITKRISEGDEREAYIIAGALMIFISGGVIALGVVIFRATIEDYIGQPVTEYILLIFIIALVMSVFRAALKGHHLVHIYAILSIGKEVSRTVIQLSLVIIGFGLVGLLVGYAIGGLVVAIGGLWYLRPGYTRPTAKHMRNIFDFAKFSWLGSIRSKTFDSVDILVLGAFVPAGLVGIYSVAYSIAKFLDIFGTAISTTMFPEMSKIASTEDIDAVSSLVEDSIIYAGLLLIPGSIGAVVIGDRLLYIYGDGFVAGTEILVILIIALTIYTYNKQLLNTLNAINRPDLAFRSNLVFIVSNVVLNVVLVWQFSWLGAAIATAISAMIGLIFAYYYTSSNINFNIPIKEISQQIGAALAMGLVVHGVRRYSESYWITEYNSVFVVILVGLGAAIYFLVLLGISSTFRTTVANNLPFDIPQRI
ncbi:oligosaccharide flippase family protein [Natrialba sp. INN-245]|uniref:oligosaccharide flippase family protein n=1 Tax=Natrialba sp. INN-245 TaxID=2690967 RepID=UPI0013100424|nr:oligosaccharide flippase family protein [Natrialba sp. INN-245]MWV40418.1 oligosaccharide flippase family protein [Natrialba sp. INN-245]